LRTAKPHSCECMSLGACSRPSTLDPRSENPRPSSFWLAAIASAGGSVPPCGEDLSEEAATPEFAAMRRSALWKNPPGNPPSGTAGAPPALPRSPAGLKHVTHALTALCLKVEIAAMEIRTLVVKKLWSTELLCGLLRKTRQKIFVANFGCGEKIIAALKKLTGRDFLSSIAPRVERNRHHQCRHHPQMISPNQSFAGKCSALLRKSNVLLSICCPWNISSSSRSPALHQPRE
jgi:hypothetical protein